MSKTDNAPRIVPGQRVRHEGGDIVTVRCCDPRFAYVEFDDKSWTVFPLHSLSPLDDEPEAAKAEYQPGDEVWVRAIYQGNNPSGLGGLVAHGGLCNSVGCEESFVIVPLSDLRKP